MSTEAALRPALEVARCTLRPAHLQIEFAHDIPLDGVSMQPVAD
jgi:hypothetical protein